MRDTRKQLPPAASLLRFHVFTVGSNGFLISSEWVLDRVAQLRTHTLPGLRGWMTKGELAEQELPVIDLRRKFSVRTSRTVHGVETSPGIIVKWKLCRVGIAIDMLDPTSVEINAKEILVIRPATDFPIIGVVTIDARPYYVLGLEELLTESEVTTALALARAMLRSE